MAECTFQKFLLFICFNVVMVICLFMVVNHKDKGEWLQQLIENDFNIIVDTKEHF